MKSKENLVFLGMMGSGKTSIGLITAKKLELDFIDIDKEIEKKMGTKISKIFENEVEAHFRKIEEILTLKLLKKQKTVLSLGGGSILNNKIRKEVLENHISFWLNWDTKTLINRIKNSKKRPLAFKSTDQEIKKMIKKRSKIYSYAQFKINCNKLTKTEIVKKIIKMYELN